jgi:CRISPR-associated protein Cas1
MTAWLEHFLSAENFMQAWQKVRANDGCAGVDGETIAQIGNDVEAMLTRLGREVEEGRYQPLPLRQIWIPKRQGWRSLNVPAVRDRIVQQAVLQVLHPLLEPQFEHCSYAYRPGRSHKMAVRQVIVWRNRGYTWVLDADMVSYFDHVGHGRLLAELEEKLRLEAANRYKTVGMGRSGWEPFLARVLNLVEQWITVPSLTAAGLVVPREGIPQGAVISPILANVYLDDLDEILLAMPQVRFVRFADDFVVLGKSRRAIEEATAVVEQFLQSAGLRFHPEKTCITQFEKGFRFLGHIFCGELVLECSRQREVEAKAQRSPHLRVVHADPVVRPTGMQRALVQALAGRGEPIPPPLFVVLGYAVRSPSNKPIEITTQEGEWRSGMSTVYLVQQGSRLSQERDRFLVRMGKQSQVEIPMREVERVLVFGNVQLTTQAVSSCLELGIPVVFLTQLGDYKGHLWSATEGDLALEMAQFRRLSEEGFQRAMARSLVQGKIWNSRQLLLRLNRKRQLPEVEGAIAGLDRDFRAVGLVENTPTLDAIRGYEGAAAARYFGALSMLIVNPGFVFTKRVFHPPTDPMNSLLSFGYTLLFNNVLSLLLAAGLNPHLGHLHGAERKKAYLAFDLMEEFRSPVVDTLVIRLVNQKIISPTDFSYPNAAGGVYLTDPARRIFLKYFEERISEEISHPDVEDRVSYRRVIELQIRRYVKVLLGNGTYESYRRII